jgi:hypothetical protein
VQRARTCAALCGLGRDGAVAPLGFDVTNRVIGSSILHRSLERARVARDAAHQPEVVLLGHLHRVSGLARGPVSAGRAEDLRRVAKYVPQVGRSVGHENSGARTMSTSRRRAASGSEPSAHEAGRRSRSTALQGARSSATARKRAPGHSLYQLRDRILQDATARRSRSRSVSAHGRARQGFRPGPVQ